MPFLQLPLSGDVTQTINPWTWFINAMGNQFGVININLGKSSDPELEQKILTEVGTYGRQLGRMGEALQVLLNHIKLDELGPEERKAVTAFLAMQDDIARLKGQQQMLKAKPG